MTLQQFVLGACAFFVAFVFEHLPMPDLLSWLQPQWALLAVTLLVLNAPKVYGLWLAVPAGLMMDAEAGSLLGLHVITFSIHIFLVQVFIRRLDGFNLVQQMLMVLILALAHQLALFWVSQMMQAYPKPIDIWGPALTSMLVWPWVYAITQLTIRKLLS